MITLLRINELSFDTLVAPLMCLSHTTTDSEVDLCTLPEPELDKTLTLCHTLLRLALVESDKGHHLDCCYGLALAANVYSGTHPGTVLNSQTPL